MRRVLSLSAVILLLWVGLALAATNVFYSVCPYGSGNIMTGNPTISISGGVATLSVAQEGNIGQGCRITYGGSSVCYISRVNSPTSYNVITATGGVPGDVSGQVVNSIAHEYASLSAAVAGARDANHLGSNDLPAIDVMLNLACYYDHDDYTTDATPVNLASDSYVTDATIYLRIYTPTGGVQSINSQRHEGVWDNDKYVISVNYGQPIQIEQSGVVIDGLQLENTGNQNYGGCRGVLINNTGASGLIAITNLQPAGKYIWLGVDKWRNY